MRILFISNLYPPHFVGGYEQICFDVARGLTARGHDLHVLTSRFRMHADPADAPNVYRTLKLKSKASLPPSAAMSGVGRNAADAGWHNARAVRRILARLRPDVVMIWGGNNLGRAYLSAVEAHPRVVYYLSDPWLRGVLAQQNRVQRPAPAQRLFHAGLRLIGIPHRPLRADHLIFCSRALRDEYAQAGGRVRHGTIIYHGVAPAVFAPQAQHILAHAPGEPYRILYAGRIAAEKGVSTLVRALRIVRADAGLEQTRLAVLGTFQSPAYEHELRSLIADLGLGEAVEFPARLPRTALAGVYAQHDVLAFPSEWQEPFALILLEAMCTGLPVVASRCGGSAEIVRDGENAVAFRAGDPDDLARGLTWAVTHPREAAALGRAASREVQAHYTLDGQIAAVEDYLQALAGPAPAFVSLPR
jgi:glycosyltransferase involved in cell wall biosynthesis